jgi:hypothetical protein
MFLEDFPMRQRPVKSSCLHLTFSSLSGSCTPGTTGRQLWPNKLDTPDTTSGQTTRARCLMLGTAPPISDRRKGADILKGIPRGQQATPHGTREPPWNQMIDQGDWLRRGCAMWTPLDRHDDTSHALQPKGSQSLDSKVLTSR